MTDDAITIQGLRRSFGALKAVDFVDLTVARGECFALLGPNGAGKTTTVEILEGFQHRDGGIVSVLGHDPGTGSQGLRSRIGIVGQDSWLDPFLTTAEMLRQTAGSYPRPRQVDEILALIGLTEKRNTRVGRLSGGQRRRLDVGLALIGDPDLLFLDEPTTGFDPDARRAAWAMVRGFRDLGKTVLLTTHYMEEAQALADRLAVIASGRIIAQGTPASLGGRDRAATLIRFRTVAPLPELPGAVTHRDGDRVRITTDNPVGVLHQITGWAQSNHIDLTDIDVARPSLEDTYLRLIDAAGPA